MRARDAQVGVWGYLSGEVKEGARVVVRIEQLGPKAGEVGVSRWEVEGAVNLMKVNHWEVVNVERVEPITEPRTLLRCMAAEYDIRAKGFREAAKDAQESAERVRRTLSEATAFESKGTLP